MSNKSKKLVGIVLIILCLISTAIGMVIFGHGSIYASADTVKKDSEIYVFAKTSEEECSVRLKDKTIVTAIIPEKAELDGKEYTVSSITNNGFASATNLQKVRLPKTVKSIGASAFSGCKALTSFTLNAVESIGANAFASTNLEYLIIPETVNKVASSILRNCDTQVYVRAGLSEGATLPEGTWATNWNTANKNQNVEFASTYIPEIKYKEIMASQLAINTFSLLTETEDYVVGYDVDEFQEFCSANTNEFNELYIPAIYNGKPVMGIANSAFYGNDINKIVIGYSENPITISSYAFDSFNGETIIINRDVIFEDNDSWGTETIVSENVFSNSALVRVVLPDTINNLGAYAFMGCSQLSDVLFVSPENRTKDEELSMVDDIQLTSTVNLPSATSFTTIGSYAFCDTPNIQNIYIHQNVQNVGYDILSGWSYTVNGQKAIIDFSNENSLPAGWDSLWHENCEEAVIEYNDLTEYNITYFINKEGAVHNNPTTVTRKDSFTLKEAELKGYIFVGWYKNSDFSGDIVTEIKSGTKENITLYGYLTEITYEIKYEGNKPNDSTYDVTGSMPNSINIRYEQTIELFSNDFELKGWTFRMWTTEADGSGDFYIPPIKVKNLTMINNGTVTLYAQWKQKEYSINYNANQPANASQTINGNMDVSSYKYEEYGNLSNINYTLTGWQFTKWTTNADGSGVSYLNGAQVHNLIEEGEITLYAQWEAITYDVIFVANEPVGANVTGNTSNITFIYDEYKNLTNHGYSSPTFEFSHWTTLSSGGGTSYYNGQSVRNLTSEDGGVVRLFAQWTPKSLPYCYHNGSYEIAHISQLKELSTYGTNEWTFKLMSDITADDWGAIPEFNGTLNLNSHSITYNKQLKETTSYGFIVNNKGIIQNGTFIPTIEVLVKGDFSGELGGVCITNYGKIENVIVESQLGRGNETFTSDNRNVDFNAPSTIWRCGGIASVNPGVIYKCKNSASMGGEILTCGGIAGGGNGQIIDCNNFGNMYLAQDKGGRFLRFGGIIGFAGGEEGAVTNCTNYGDILFCVQSAPNPATVWMAQIAAYAYTCVSFSENRCCGYVAYHQVNLASGRNYITNGEIGELAEYNDGGNTEHCIATNTFITLADGSQKMVQDLTGNEKLLVWNLYTGTFDSAPILFIDREQQQIYEVINLLFSDGTKVKVIGEHAFWDFNLNEYVFLRNDAEKYIGHWFNKQLEDTCGNFSWKKVQLIEVVISQELTTAWSPVTYGHLCYYVDGMLSMPGATEGLINIFEVDSETLKINEELMQRDIETFGLFTYEEFSEIYPITEEMFNAFGGQYLKISIGKGLITLEEIGKLINRYVKFIN